MIEKKTNNKGFGILFFLLFVILGLWPIIKGNQINIYNRFQYTNTKKGLVSFIDFNYVDDCVNALLLAGAKDESNGKVYNLGSNEVICLKDLAELMTSLGLEGNYELVPFPTERKSIDIGDYYSDFSLIRNELEWLPTIKLQNGLKKTLDYYLKNHSHYWNK